MQVSEVDFLYIALIRYSVSYQGPSTIKLIFFSEKKNTWNLTGVRLAPEHVRECLIVSYINMFLELVLSFFFLCRV